MNKPIKKPTKIDQLLESSRQISDENSGGREEIAKGIVSALLGPASQETPSMKIPLGRILRSPFQPRVEFDPKELKELADSIVEAGGLIHPIMTRQLPSGDYELLAGERRLQAHEKILQWPEIDAIVRDLDNATSAKVTIIENLNRVDLSDFEKSRALPILREHSAATTNVELAKILGCDEKLVRSLWKFQSLPENVISQLMISPRVLTITFVDDVLAWCEKGFGLIVQEALRLAADGKLKNKGILTYIERKAAGPNARITKKGTDLKNLDQQLIATMNVARSKITLDIPKNIEISIVEQVITAAIAGMNAESVKNVEK
ncbi:ParB/RepB/Spo0J family partition protein [Deefgea rivuli]|uniref:ParB/RepB/Spo0J family partition protein n=1 Tax=Deefgea rivuli TaxID=400948 RepID=UPI000686AB63|nr:ParB/RepB/Spo0J family partition protein [Deefgea rivuli]